MLNEMTKAESIPIIETNEIEYNAGCFAKIRTPTPKRVVITESIIDVLWVGKAEPPARYSCNNPFVIKMQ